MKRISALFSAALLVASISSFANAQGVLDQAYGRGVHAYFAGNTDRAIEWLDQAINNGSEDPRVYYFHGLALIQQSGGAVDAGLADFEQAASLEVTSGRVVNVGRALERVQGSVRRSIEDIRLRVMIENKDKLPRTPSVAPSAPANLDSAIDPFGDDTGLTTGEPEEMATPPSSVVPETAEPATDFGDAPATDEAPATDAASPFGDDSAAEASPFGEASGTTESNPFE